MALILLQNPLHLLPVRLRVGKGSEEDVHVKRIFNRAVVALLLLQLLLDQCRLRVLCESKNVLDEDNVLLDKTLLQLLEVEGLAELDEDLGVLVAFQQILEKLRGLRHHVVDLLSLIDRLEAAAAVVVLLREENDEVLNEINHLVSS